MYACINVEGNEMMDGQTNKWMAGGVIQFHLSVMKIKLIKGSLCKVNIKFFCITSTTIAIKKVYYQLIYLQPTD